MPELINYPPLLAGTARDQILQLRSYLATTAEALNRNLQDIGGNDLTDRERASVQGILRTGGGLDSVASLRDMVVQLAEYVKKSVEQIKQSPIAGEVESGRFGQYVMTTSIGVPADLDGHNRTEQLISILQKLKQDDLTVRNWFYAGTLREGVTGAAIGKDVVTFAQDGTETFTPGNAAIEILTDGTINIPGTVEDRTTTETDFDNITAAGTYWVDVDGMTHGPTGLSSGDCLLDVHTTTGIIRQRLEAAAAVYIRRKTGDTWGGWIAYAGTAQ